MRSDFLSLQNDEAHNLNLHIEFAEFRTLPVTFEQYYFAAYPKIFAYVTCGHRVFEIRRECSSSLKRDGQRGGPVCIGVYNSVR